MSAPLINKEKLKIVPMGLADIEDVFNIESRCHSHPWSKKLFLSNFGTRYFSHLLLADEQVIGYFVASSVAGEVTLMNIAITPEVQGQGLGEILLQFLKDYSQAKDEEEVWLEVRASNLYALKLYQKLGFVELDRRKDYYPCKNGREDAVIMCCYLSL
ncbi:ribosomal protein S18-alanine N-acetyltransferase [Psychromonas sp. MB-3u-54]|uniref:ribosomal protein S18-alanine N-acetyltransferase n=1 Tax=Psychromonas sp. MB-3u-54 TaxID=2058319 RepID=UPI001E57457B|nr:ribosomal protein S18-alanine N-acetyltransferase [Psychromonas sp. MB-3u-54]